MDKSAIRPNFYKDFTSHIEEVESETTNLDQKDLAYISHFKGWTLVKEYGDRLNEYLDNLVSEAMAQGLSVSEIGERTMVKELTKFAFNSLFRKVEDARRGIDK